MSLHALKLLSSPAAVTEIIEEYLAETKDHLYPYFADRIITNFVTSVVFLDVDGVILRQSDITAEKVYEACKRYFPTVTDYDQYQLNKGMADCFSPAALERLEEIFDSDEVVAVVLSSSWREGFSPLALRKLFSKHSFSIRLLDKTMDSDSLNSRAFEIFFWLFNHPTVRRIAILDDQDDQLSDKFGEHFIWTSSSKLLTQENVIDAENALKLTWIL